MFGGYSQTALVQFGLCIGQLINAVYNVLSEIISKDGAHPIVFSFYRDIFAAPILFAAAWYVDGGIRWPRQEDFPRVVAQGESEETECPRPKRSWSARKSRLVFVCRACKNIYLLCIEIPVHHQQQQHDISRLASLRLSLSLVACASPFPAGFLGVFCNQVLFLYGVKMTNATVASIVHLTMPLFAAALAVGFGLVGEEGAIRHV